MAAIELLNTPLFDDPTLQVYYRFEGNSNDSKNSNNGTATAVTYSSGNGKFGEGVGFDETIPSNVALPYQIPFGDFSMTFWVKGTSSGFPTMFQSNDISLNEIMGITAGGAGTGVPSFVIFSSDTNIYQASAVTNVFDGNFHMITCTLNSSTGEQLIYVDGVSEGNTTFAGDFPTSDNSAIGNPFDFGGSEAIDEFAIFTSVLSPTNISNLFNGTFPPSGPVTSPTFLFNLI